MAVNDSVTQNLLPVQAYFDLQGNFQTFIGQNKPFYASINPIQSGLSITNSTIDSTTIGATAPSTGVFTNITTTTGTILTTPSSSTDIANKFYVDTVAQGLGPKAACQVATTANITLSGLQTIDGYTTLAGDRVLVKNQSTSSQNGIYIASASAWTRSVDMDVWSEVPGAYTVILNGGQQDQGWVCVASQTGTIGVTAMPWVQFSGATSYTAGTGLTLTANQFSITNTGVSANSYGSASSVATFTVNAQGQLTAAASTAIAIANTQVSGLGTMSTQNANSVAITGGSINGTTIGGTTAGAITGTTITANNSFSGAGTGLTGTAASLSIGGNAATATYATTAGSAGSATTATTATNLAGGAAYSVPYQTGAGATTFLASGTGVLQDNGTLDWTNAPTLVGTNFSSIPNTALTNSSITIGTTNIALGATASTLTSVTMATPTISSYETYTAISAPSYNAGRLWYDSSVNSLAYYNDITNNTLHIGQEIQLKVYNNTGSTINVGQPVYVTSTSSGFTYPNVALAIANSLTTANVIGLANQAIPTSTAGYVTTIGLIQGVNTGTYTVGDTLYLSPYSAGFYQNTIPPTGYAIKIGTVAYVNSSTGSIYVNKSNLSTQAGNIIGQVALANGGTNANLTAVAGGIVYSGASALAISAAGSSGQFLQSNGTSAPTWATPVSYASVTDDTTTNATRYPLFANQTSGNLATEYTSSTKYQYNPSTGTLTASIFSGAGTGLTGTATSLSIGGNAATATSATSATTATTATNLAGGATGSLPYQSAASTTTFLAASTNGYILTLASGLPSWAPAPVTGITITDNTSSTSTYYPAMTTATSGTITGETTSSTKFSFVPSTGTLSATAFSGSGANLTGVVNSVTGTSPVVSSGGQNPAISLATGYGDTQNPYASKTANYFLAAPNGSAGAPTFRAIVSADIPTLNQNTTGTASNITASSNSTLTTLSALSLPGSQVSGNISGNAATATTATNLAGGANGSLPYQTGSGATTFLAAGTNGYVLTLASGVPTWAASTGGVASFSAGTTGFTPSTATTGAITLAGTLNGASGGTGVNNGSNTITVAGNLTHAGAFTQSFTATANTAVTLPAGATAASNNLISSATAVPIVTGTPSSTSYLRGDGTWASIGSGIASYTRTSFTATASQTTFTVTYTVGYLQVYVNGVLLNSTDYTASNGTSIILGVACTVGDIVETIAYATTAIAVAGGANTQVQYNSSGNLAGSANMTFDGTTLTAAGLSGPFNGTVGATTPNTGLFTTLGANASTTASANKGAIYYGTLGYSDTSILASYQSSVAGYNQVILQNTSNNAAASTNFNISNDGGTATTNFGEFGINSSTFSGTGAFNAAGSVYLASASTDLAIGTYGSNAIHFVVNSGATDAATISSAGLLTANSFASSSSAITGGSINGTTVGASTASTGRFTSITATTGTITPATGTASVAPISLTSGTNLTSAVAGAIEYDGNNLYITTDTTQGRGVVKSVQQFYLSSAVTAFGPTVGNFFGSTSAASLAATSSYDIECYCYFLKTTSGTATWAPTFSTAPTVCHAALEYTPVTGFTTSLISGAMVIAEETAQAVASMAFAATASLTSAVYHLAKFKIRVTTNTACNFRLNFTGSAGTITPQAGSWYTVRKVVTSAGNFVA